jgi:hypothetical protein
VELLAEFTGRPSVGVELARLLDQPASAKPVPLVTGVGNVGKSAVAAADAQAAGRLNRGLNGRLVFPGASPSQGSIFNTHSSCNLPCDYCYMYEIADETWRARPGRMSVASAEAMVGVGQKRMDAVATEMASVRYTAEQVR